MPLLKNTTAVVTGAGRGLGAALAVTLAEAGCRLVLCGRNLGALAETAAAVLERSGVDAMLVELDLSDADSVARAAGAIHAGHDAIDILINNGAQWLEGAAEPHAPSDVLGVINAAVSGTYLLTQGLLPLLERSARPDILTIGSISGLPNAALQTAAVPFYAAKRAQAGLADGFAQVLKGTPVRSLIVHPPYLDDAEPGSDAWRLSPERAKGERATSRDIADAVIFALTRPRHVSLSILVDADDGGRFADAG
ncbi:NAD(P)-dependent dehydrogenase (short-subunit alcohol dehydrogenase family) [Brevundimonas faecalis]|uniref:NAD(P)-dependent dehydrogenase (Short-subunit alcohol dehydrogenase family) n=1 Tax=Brevundimonas faecalis TaxID=947378 RepID=A0ABV2RB47_9CAUL